MSLASINPATGEVVETFQPLSDSALEQCLQRAVSAFSAQQTTTFAQRAQCMSRAADILERDCDRLGRIMTAEMGKPLKAAIAEAAKCALACRYYVENAERLMADVHVKTDATQSLVRYQPLGTILAVMPWNFPFWQVIRFAAPALMAGNTALLKHASNVPRCALAIEKLFLEAGFSEGVLQTLLIGSDRVPRVLADRRVAAATLTGSVEAGRKVAALAGQHLKKTVLELGGSDPFVVMPSAAIEQAARVAVDARVVNNGQSCIAAKRFIVAEPIADEFERRFVERMRQLRMGDPMEPSTDIGPLATEEVLADVEQQVDVSVRMGARCLLGGKRVQGRGWFYEPTVLTDIPTDSPAAQDEIFGPVAAIFRVKDAAEAIRIANDTCFGLGASVWTRDPREEERFVNEIVAGMVFVNRMVISDPRIPFGGVKDSGYGRELGALGILEFVNAKTIMIQRDAPA
ncbi:MAG: NAD-dependent succinate-semialdehyde dehydrogenase [Deltaproteobacteria bacterium]|nr:NAD-dependent succinate-semialdehyde dehydrogenase [Deltaproteobacteria bacterium]